MPNLRELAVGSTAFQKVKVLEEQPDHPLREDLQVGLRRALMPEFWRTLRGQQTDMLPRCRGVLEFGG
jgi:hypothetical protein